MIDVSIIIVSYNTRKLLTECLQSIKEYTKEVNYEIIVVDNASTDGSVKEIQNDKEYRNRKRLAKFKIIQNRENVGFARANNQGMKEAKGRYILLLNSDTKLKEDSLTKMVMWMDKHSLTSYKRPKAGAFTCTLVGQDGRIQPNGGSFPTLLRVFLWATFLDDIPGLTVILGSYHSSAAVPLSKNIYNKEHQKDWISGAAFLLRRDVFEEVGGFDEKLFMYGEDFEYCFRIKKRGWQIWYSPITQIVHLGFGSGKGDVVKFAKAYVGKEGGIIGEFEGLKYFYKKHQSGWQYPVLLLFLKLGAMLRILLFGVFGGQKEARRVYAKAFATI